MVELLVEKSAVGLFTIARGTRRWLQSAQREEIKQRPITRLRNLESQPRYAGYMIMFVYGFLRIIGTEEARAASGSDDTSSEDNNTAEGSTCDDGAGSSSNVSNGRNRR